jgi:hypothetical protein
MARKLMVLKINRQIGMCPPSDWETVFIWVEHRDGRPVYSDAQSQLEAYRPDWCVVRDPEHILWAEEIQ